MGLKIEHLQGSCGISFVHHFLDEVSWHQKDANLYISGQKLPRVALTGANFMEWATAEKHMKEHEKNIKDWCKANTEDAGLMCFINENQFRVLSEWFEEMGFEMVVRGVKSKRHGNRIYELFRSNGHAGSSEKTLTALSYKIARRELRE